MISENHEKLKTHLFCISSEYINTKISSVDIPTGEGLGGPKREHAHKNKLRNDTKVKHNRV
jgi:hypothetical protein